MKTIINILGSIYFLWIRGAADREGHYQDWKKTWEAGNTLNLQWYITKEDSPDADRLAFRDGGMDLLPPSDHGSVFGYIWCSQEYMVGRNGYEHGLVGMRYGWEKALETVFSDASTPEFNWRLRVSDTVYKEMTKIPVTQKVPAGMQQSALEIQDMPELFKTKISELSFREKLQRYMRKPTTKVYEAIIDEYTMFEMEKKLDIIGKLEAAQFVSPHMVEIYEELYDIGRVEDNRAQASIGVTPSEELPEGL